MICYEFAAILNHASDDEKMNWFYVLNIWISLILYSRSQHPLFPAFPQLVSSLNNHEYWTSAYEEDKGVGHNLAILGRKRGRRKRKGRGRGKGGHGRFLNQLPRPWFSFWSECRAKFSTLSHTTNCRKSQFYVSKSLPKSLWLYSKSTDEGSSKNSRSSVIQAHHFQICEKPNHTAQRW